VYDPAMGTADIFGDSRRYVYQGFAVYGLRHTLTGSVGWEIVWNVVQPSRSEDWVRERADQRLALNHEWIQSGGKAFAATWYWSTLQQWQHQHTLLNPDDIVIVAAQ